MTIDQLARLRAMQEDRQGLWGMTPCDKDALGAALEQPSPKTIAALEAVLLYYSPSPWDNEKQIRWQQLTGKNLSTTKTLCDFVREAIK